MAETPQVKPLEMSLNSIWMLQPDYKGIRQSLEKKDYTLKEQIRGSVIVIAKKGTVDILVNPERRVLSISSETSSKDLLTAYEDLDQSYLEVGLEPSNLLFVEFIGNYLFQSNFSPMKKLNSLKIEGDILAKIGTVLEKDIVPFGLVLTTKESNPTTNSWFSFSINPLPPSANKSYLITTVFRGKKEEVLDFVKNIEKRIPRVIEKIEGN
jgi:hypothetical protein